jgi:hypothetical protein
MRTAPLETLTHAAIVLDTGAAMAVVATRSEATNKPDNLREDIDTSGESL